MRNKGFTLIELLAVIVILAIISLIAIPIIVNIIEDSKEASRLRSAELYISTLNTSLVKQALKGPVPNGTYDVMNNGNLCLGEIQNNTCNGTEVKVEMEGTLPTRGSITIENGKITDIQGLTIEGYVYGYDETNQLVKSDEHEEINSHTLLTGSNFNTNIKTLVKGLTVSSSETEDSIVEYIEFYSNGELPEGHTLSELRSLQSADVSNENDESIIAYYDSTKKSVYIYSDGEIIWNDNSNNMFENFNNLREFEIPYNVTSIGDSAFSFCGSLTSITIPNSVTSIGDSAFYSCSSLTSITIPDSVTSIGDMAFFGCESLANVTIGNGVTNISDSTFWGCNLTNIILPNSLISIEYGAFGYSQITSITIPESVISISQGAFDQCYSLTSVTFKEPNGWWYASSADATSGTSLDLSNVSNNATYLKSTYVNKYWKRS